MKTYIFTTIVSLLLVLVFPAELRAAEIALQGVAEVLSTGNTFDFDQYNSDVVVDSTTGALSGHVWSEDLGWLDFSNNGEGDGAMVDLDDGTVTGQAYATNTDTHVYFSEYNSNVEIDLASGGINGYAWSDDLGWISFSTVEVAGGLLPLQDTGQNVLPWMLMSGGLMGAGVVLRKRKRVRA